MKIDINKEIKNLGDISDEYNGFLIDLWGVVHNGLKLFPGIINILERLIDKRKEIIFITNAPRRSKIIKKQLAEFGISSEFYKDVVSSGEISWLWMKKNSMAANDKLTCFHIGPPRDNNLLEETDILKTKIITKADFILNTGPWGDEDKLANYTSTLDKLNDMKLPMICSNPDKMVVRGESFMICAGLLAEYYENIGGKVDYFGKPFSSIYNHCFKILKEKNKTKILVIGDSLENDIKGACDQKLDSLLVTTGIHRKVNNNNHIDIKKLNDLMIEKNIFSKFFTSELVW